MRIRTLVLSLTVLATAGCASMIPPQKIPTDRRNYLDAVSISWKEQLLRNVVALRYGEALTSLEMTSITTGYELDANFGVGNNTVVTDRVSVGGSATYSYKPTISYVPIRGDALQKTMIEPVDPLKILKGLQTGWEADYVLPCSVKCINDWRSPSDPKFFELATTFQVLKKWGVIRIAAEEPVEPKVTKVPTDYTVTMKKQVKSCEEETDKKKEEKEDGTIGFLVVDRDRAEIEATDRGHIINLKETLGEFKKLLWPKYTDLEEAWHKSYNKKCGGCHKAPAEEPKFQTCDMEQEITRAVTCGHGQMHKIANIKPSELKGIISFIKHSHPGRYEVYKIIDANQKLPLDPYCDKLVMQTQSILQTLTILSRLINVPPEHTNKAEEKRDDYKDMSDTLKLKINWDKQCPENAFVAIKYRGFWFFIDDNDYRSKEVFTSTEGIFSMSETGTKEGAPVLTLPVQ
jgi:hypothetical protein